MTTSFHVSNFGAFGGALPRDMDGYCHLTAAGWLAAPMDGEIDAEQAEEMAQAARDAVAAAEAGLDEWRGRQPI